MDTINKIEILLKQNNLNQKDLTNYLNVGENLFSKWKKGTSASYLKYIDRIAKYLNVSTDYLLGTEQKNNSPSELDSKLLEIYNQLSAEGKAKLMEQAQLLRQAGK